MSVMMRVILKESLCSEVRYFYEIGFCAPLLVVGLFFVSEKVMAMKSIFLVIVLMFIGACSTGSKHQDQVSHAVQEQKVRNYEGVLKNSYYTNTSVPMVMEFPRGWYVRDNIDTSKLILIGEPSQNVAVKPLLRKTSRLFYISKFKGGKLGKPNPSISANVFQLTDKKASPATHNAQIKESLLKAKMSYEFPESVFDQKIAGTEYHVLSAKVDIQGVPIFQKYYTTKIDDQMLSFLMTYNSDAQLLELSSLLKGVEYQK